MIHNLVDMDDFLLTYRSYSNPAQLLDCLIQRFNTAHVSDKKVVHLRLKKIMYKQLLISQDLHSFRKVDFRLLVRFRNR
jgi:hypothetical protein